MSSLSRPQWLRAIVRNPVYVREKGGWGKPNPFYDRLSRFSPFVVIGAILFGLCAGVGNPALFFGNEELLAFWCFLCLPALLLNILTTFGTLMAPTLTAPTISMEMDRGTWEILRATPLPMRTIVTAKLLGALARLRIWPALFALSLLQGLLLTCSLTVVNGPSRFAGPIVGVSTAARPWLEVFFAGLVGMYASTRIRSATIALATSYAVVIGIKIMNSSSLWMLVSGLLKSESTFLLAGSIGPVITYAILLAGLWFGLMNQADRIAYE